jgi:O-antigen ligase
MAVLEKSAARVEWRQRFVSTTEPMRGAFFWLSAFYVVYCARPEDWIPGLKYLPLAKISGIFAVLGFVFSAGRSRRSIRHLPREAFYLVAMIGMLLLAGLLSPVWKGGGVIKTVEFAKVLVAWVLTYLVITSFARLRRIIFIQSASVVLIAIVSLLKGRDHPRLEGVIGGIYSNPNDLAFAIVLSLPFCVAFLLYTKKLPRKAAWVLAMLAMCTALFLTASRGGFITLLATAAVGLWHFGVKGRRPQLIAAVLLVGLVVGVTAGGRLKDRFIAISGEELNDSVDVSAHGSYEQRALLMEKSVEGIVHYPLGIGLGNFPNYSGTWREVHVAYLQIAVEGGIAACIFYLLFFERGFANLRRLRHVGDMDGETELFAGALHSSLIGFLVGALFAPEAYQFFPYFAVVYTSVLLAIAQEKVQPDGIADSTVRPQWKRRYVKAEDLTAVR